MIHPDSLDSTRAGLRSVGAGAPRISPRGRRSPRSSLAVAACSTGGTLFACSVYRPDEAWALRARAAAGYSTPTASNLFVTPAGLPGNHTGLRTQTVAGLDLGVDRTPTAEVALSVTAYGEALRNELISQSPGAGLLAYTFNAPASTHRGVEVGGDWAFAPSWRGVLAYAYNDQFYTRYVETLLAGAVAATFDRAGRAVPGVSAHQALVRIGYDQPNGPFAGLGGYVEYFAMSAFFVDSANLLKVPGYGLINANVHYRRDLSDGPARRIDLYAEIRNVLGTTYVASAQNLTNTIDAVTGRQNGAGVLAATTGSIFSGAPRTFVCGMKLAF